MWVGRVGVCADDGQLFAEVSTMQVPPASSTAEQRVDERRRRRYRGWDKPWWCACLATDEVRSEVGYREAGWEEGTHRGGVRALENVLPWNAVRPEIIAWVLSRLAAGEHPQERGSRGGRETRTQRVDACVWCVFQATSA
mgnify:CR=1 FL=1